MVTKKKQALPRRQVGKYTLEIRARGRGEFAIEIVGSPLIYSTFRATMSDFPKLSGQLAKATEGAVAFALRRQIRECVHAIERDRHRLEMLGAVLANGSPRENGVANQEEETVSNNQKQSTKETSPASSSVASTRGD